MEYIRTYSAKGVLTALGKSLLYLLFFLAVQFLAGIVYAAIAAAGASLLPGGVDAESIMAGTETVVLLTYLLTAAAIGLRRTRCSPKQLRRRVCAAAPAGRRPSVRSALWTFSWWYS